MTLITLALYHSHHHPTSSSPLFSSMKYPHSKESLNIFLQVIHSLVLTYQFTRQVKRKKEEGNLILYALHHACLMNWFKSYLVWPNQIMFDMSRVVGVSSLGSAEVVLGLIFNIWIFIYFCIYFKVTNKLIQI